MNEKIKNKIIVIAAVVIYGVILSSLLAIQSACIQGKLESMIASVFTIIISIPSMVIIYVYTKISIYDEKKEISDTIIERKQVELNFDEFSSLELNKDLSRREIEVAWLTFKQYTNRQIADELYISETTVKKHITHIFEKTDIHGRKDYIEKVNDIKNMKK